MINKYLKGYKKYRLNTCRMRIGGFRMKELSDHLLYRVYNKAKELQFDKEFLNSLKKEIQRRKTRKPQTKEKN